MQLSQAARSVWAKSTDKRGRWLPLWQHMDDAADVAADLVVHWLPPSVVRLLADCFGGDSTQARAAVTFLAGVHDLGKATPAFAVQDTALAQRMCEHHLDVPPQKSELRDRHLAHHAIAGHHLLMRWLTARGWSKSTARTWGVVLASHHGVPPDSDAEEMAHPTLVRDLYGRGLWEDVQHELVERMALRAYSYGF